MLENVNNYGPYLEMVNTKRQQIFAKDINIMNWDSHFTSILNIMRDGIELEQFRTSFVNVVFADGLDVDLSIPDYFVNLIMWILPIYTNTELSSEYLFFEENITRKTIKNYIDYKFIDVNRGVIKNIQMNNIIDDCLSKFIYVDEFSMYLCNTINLEDTLDLMNMYPEFDQAIHVDISNVPLDQVSRVGMEAAERQISIIKNSDTHCFRDFFRSGEGINPRQYKEVFSNIGTKPDGRGGVYPAVIGNSFITGGANDFLSFYMEKSNGRVAQIIVEGNVGISGAFARLLGLNNIDTILHPNPEYVCNSQNFQMIEMKEGMLSRFENQYYRLHPNGEEKLITRKDKHLIGQTIYLRSPMTCSSHARGEGICYRCYGKLAHSNEDINIGKIAAEETSSQLTQKMLSAKHLLEAAVKSMKFSKGFSKIFEINYNVIQLLDTANEQCKLLINKDDITPENDLEEVSSSEYNEYVSSFHIATPTGELIPVYSLNGEGAYNNMYISTDLSHIIESKGYVYDDDNIAINFSDLKETSLFLMKIHNNDLSDILDGVKDIIDKNETFKRINNRHTWLQTLIEMIMKCGLNLSAVHAQLLLANQMRDIDDPLEYPNWDNTDELYTMLTLNKSLLNNPSVAISLAYNYQSRALYNPLTFKKSRPSVMDVFYMVNPAKQIHEPEKVAELKRNDKGLYNPLVKIEDEKK